VIVFKAKDNKLHLKTTGIQWMEVIFRDDGTFDIGGGRRIWHHYRAHYDTAGGTTVIEDLAGAVYGSTKLYRRIEPLTPTADELTQLVGDYRSAELDITYSFIVEAGVLMARSLWSPHPIIFEATLADRFDSDHGSMSTIEVVRDSGGHINGLRVHGIRIRHVLFERVRAP
jgi:hypothetical protein